MTRAGAGWLVADQVLDDLAPNAGKLHLRLDRLPEGVAGLPGPLLHGHVRACPRSAHRAIDVPAPVSGGGFPLLLWRRYDVLYPQTTGGTVQRLTVDLRRR